MQDFPKFDEKDKISIRNTGWFKVRIYPSGKNDAISEFLNELTALTVKHHIIVHGCGCCGSPLLYDEEANELAENLRFDKNKKKLHGGVFF